MLKQMWAAKVTFVGTHLRHLYEGNTMTGIRHEVYVVAQVGEGREKGREITLEMTNEEALKFANDLRLRALENGHRNKARGLA